MSQSELAEKLDIHKKVGGKYEREEVESSIDITLKIANYMGISLDYLLGKVNKETVGS